MTRRNTDEYIRVAGQPAGNPGPEREDPALKEELLSVLLHDLRSPIGAIGVLTDLFARLADHGTPADPRQIQLLQEAVTKLQRVMDDAVEIQSIIRGSSSFSPTGIEIGTLIASSLDKATHASYLKDVRVNYDANGSSHRLISTDVEKAETVLLCLIEALAENLDKPAAIRISQSSDGPWELIHMEWETSETGGAPTRPRHALRGRLGTRKLGESRYNIHVCRKVMQQMGGKLDLSVDLPGSMTIHFPARIT